jgi:hypothetical protein
MFKKLIQKTILYNLLFFCFFTYNTSFAEIWTPNIIDVFNDVINYNKTIETDKFNQLYSQGTEKEENTEYIKSWLQLSQENADNEINLYLENQLWKINNTPDKSELNLDNDYINLISDYEWDWESKGLFVAIWLWKWDIVKLNESYYYIFPFKNVWDEKAKAFIQKELQKTIEEKNEEKFLQLIQKYWISIMKIKDRLKNISVQIWPRFGSKLEIKTNLFSNIYYNVSDEKISSNLKTKYKLFYFWYIRYDELSSLFGSDFKIKNRWNDIFINFMDWYYSLWIFSQDKYFYETNIIKQNYFYTIDYSYNIIIKYIMYFTLFAWFAFWYLKAISFRNRQRTLLSMSPDKI